MISIIRLRITRSVCNFFFYFAFKVVVQNTYRSTLVGCKEREFESTQTRPVGAGTGTQCARDKPVHLSPITVTNALPGTVQMSTTQFRDESCPSEKYIFDIKRPFHPPEQMYARVGRNGKELDGCGIWGKVLSAPLEGLPWKGENIKGELSSRSCVVLRLLVLRIIWRWDLEYLSWSRRKERGVPL